jgi:hypothetical protein
MTIQLPIKSSDDDLRRSALPFMENALRLLDPVNCIGAALLDHAISHIRADLGLPPAELPA